MHTCNKIAGITAAHNRAAGVLVPSFPVWATLSGRQSRSRPVLGDIEMVDYLDRDLVGKTNVVLDLSIVHERHGTSRANLQDNGKLSFTDWKRVHQPLEDRARAKILK
jgi:hypothetical protein